MTPWGGQFVEKNHGVVILHGVTMGKVTMGFHHGMTNFREKPTQFLLRDPRNYPNNPNGLCLPHGVTLR